LIRSNGGRAGSGLTELLEGLLMVFRCVSGILCVIKDSRKNNREKTNKEIIKVSIKINISTGKILIINVMKALQNIKCKK
jgi:hypothetical protein